MKAKDVLFLAMTAASSSAAFLLLLNEPAPGGCFDSVGGILAKLALGVGAVILTAVCWFCTSKETRSSITNYFK